MTLTVPDLHKGSPSFKGWMLVADTCNTAGVSHHWPVVHSHVARLFQLWYLNMCEGQKPWLILIEQSFVLPTHDNMPSYCYTDLVMLILWHWYWVVYSCFTVSFCLNCYLNCYDLFIDPDEYHMDLSNESFLSRRQFTTDQKPLDITLKLFNYIFYQSCV